MSDWTEELKKQVVAQYLAQEPTPETSAEIVKDIAESIEKTPNGVRMILSKADVYVKKTAANAASASVVEAKGTRVSKAEAIGNLKAVIQATGQEPDMAILDKLTGKAAMYFVEVFKNAAPESE